MNGTGTDTVIVIEICVEGKRGKRITGASREREKGGLSFKGWAAVC